MVSTGWPHCGLAATPQLQSFPIASPGFRVAAVRGAGAHRTKNARAYARPRSTLRTPPIIWCPGTRRHGRQFRQKLHIRWGPLMETHSFQDFDAFVESVRDVDCVMLLQNPGRRRWAMSHVYLCPRSMFSWAGWAAATSSRASAGRTGTCSTCRSRRTAPTRQAAPSWRKAPSSSWSRAVSSVSAPKSSTTGVRFSSRVTSSFVATILRSHRRLQKR